jgi:hypothetical protein
MEDIIKAVQAAMAEAALTPIALNHINNLVQEAKKADERADQEAKRNAELDRTNREQADRIAKLTGEVNGLRATAEDVQAHKLSAAVAEAKAETVQECFKLVFRNAQIRETVTRDTPVPITFGDQNGTYTNVERHATTEAITREEE